MNEIQTATYTAAIGTAADVVAGDYCDVSVAENDFVGYRRGEDGVEVPEYAMSDRVVMPAVETAVRTGDGDVLGKVGPAADGILAAAGWRRAGEWFVADNAMYAPVERES